MSILSSKETAQIHFIKRIGGIQDVETAVQIVLTSPVPVASCELSFSKIKLIKSYLRSTMSQDRFTNLAVLSIENEVLSSNDFSDVIKDFAAVKSREVQF
jgi:hypothetical protein